MPDADLRSFALLLAGLEGGALHQDLTDKTQTIVAALKEARAHQGGKPKAKLTLEVEFKLDREVTEIMADVKVSMPKRARERTILYVTPDNTLTPRNPRQIEFGFRDVNTDPAQQAKTL